MTIKVIQWGAGYTGALSLRYILNNSNLELVGLYCFTESKEGRDAAEIAGLDQTSGVKATRDVDALLATEADCVIFMPRDALSDPSVEGSPSRAWVSELERILASGKNVVSSICSGTHYKHMANGAAFKTELDKACAQGQSSVLFTGLDPGFLSDCLALAMAGAVGEISQIRTWEILDYSTYTEADTLAALGFGQRPDQLGSEGAAPLLASWGGVSHLMGEAIGVTVDDITLDLDIELAKETFTTPGGMTIEAGTVAALRFSVIGHSGGTARFATNHVTRMSADVAPSWPTVGDLGGYRIEIDSFPPFVGEFPMGRPGGLGSSFGDAMAMTAARCVQAITPVVDAEPGYKTFLNLAPITGFGAMRTR